MLRFAQHDHHGYFILLLEDEAQKNNFFYFVERPMVFPKLISPLSILTEKPQLGLVQTQALYLMLAPSLP
jgi:hypothetical protein